MPFQQKRFEFWAYIVFVFLYLLSLCFENGELSRLTYRLFFTGQVISFGLHALITEMVKGNLFRLILTICGPFITVGSVYLLSRTTRVWHEFKFETLIILIMGTWQVLYTLLTFIEMKSLKEASTTFFNDDFTKNIEAEENDNEDNWVNKKFW
jgi:hypothetical protein